MIRTVGVALRKTAGSGVIFALGLGAISAGPHHLVAVSAAPAVRPQTRAVTDDDLVVPRPVRTALLIYTEAVTAATPASVSARGVPAGPAWAVGSVSGASNGFTYDYCIWWVAHKRYVPVRGNAAQWWWNARPFGYAEG